MVLVTRSLLLSLAAAGVRAQGAKLQVNLSDTESLKTAAKTVAENLLTYYHGEEYGQTVGILPGPPSEGKGPYYWWQAGGMFGTLIDYYFYTGDDSYNDITMRAMLHQAAPPDNKFMPLNWTASLGNDDQGFWGMAALGAAEVNFPNPPADQPQWLALAQAVFNSQTRRWEPEICGGGMRWQIPAINIGYDYKNTISNGVFFNLGARLARYTKNETYAEWADKAYDWLTDLGMIKPTFDIVDGGHIQDNCTALTQVQWSANAAIIIHGAAIMYNYTNGAAKWERRIVGLVNKTIDHFFPNGVMVERPCELDTHVQCNTDQHSFKGYMHRALAVAAVVAPPVRDDILRTLRSSTEGCAKSCLSDGTCGFRWTTGEYDGAREKGPAGQQMSALAALSTMMLEQGFINKAPLTADSGGTSIGDPNAGTGGDETTFFAPIRTADRAGAGIVTILVLGSFIGSLVWLTFGNE